MSLIIKSKAIDILSDAIRIPESWEHVEEDLSLFREGVFTFEFDFAPQAPRCGGPRCIALPAPDPSEFPYPSCITKTGDSEVTIALKSMDDVKKCNDWFLKVAGRTTESYHFSIVSAFIFQAIRDKMYMLPAKRDVIYEAILAKIYGMKERNIDTRCEMLRSRMEETLSKFNYSELEGVYRCDDGNYIDLFLCVMKEMSLKRMFYLVDSYTELHKKTQSIILIQDRFRKYLLMKHNAASLIQKKWRLVIVNPSFKVCKNRLMWELKSML